MLIKQPQKANSNYKVHKGLQRGLVIRTGAHDYVPRDGGGLASFRARDNLPGYLDFYPEVPLKAHVKGLLSNLVLLGGDGLLMPQGASYLYAHALTHTHIHRYT